MSNNVLQEVSDAQKALTVKIIGVNRKDPFKVREWGAKLQALTCEVADNIEDATYEGFKLLADEAVTLIFRHKANKCSKKRRHPDKLSEFERAEKLRVDDPSTYYLCLLLISILAMEEGFEAIENFDLESMIDKAYDRGNEERADKLSELNDEMNVVHEALGLDTLDRIHQAILDGDKDTIVALAHADHGYVLDMGYHDRDEN